jgi:hypothetical protein
MPFPYSNIREWIEDWQRDGDLVFFPLQWTKVMPVVCASSIIGTLKTDKPKISIPRTGEKGMGES